MEPPFIFKCTNFLMVIYIESLTKFQVIGTLKNMSS